VKLIGYGDSLTMQIDLGEAGARRRGEVVWAEVNYLASYSSHF